MLNYKHNEVKKGDTIKSSEWNNMGFGVHGLFNDDITLFGNKDFKGDLNTAGELTVENDINAKNNLNIKGDLNITGTLSAKADLKVSGSITAASDLAVKGHTDLTSISAGEIKVQGPVVRKVHVATGLGPNEEINAGQLNSRVLTFTKQFEDTSIRIVYSDIFRTCGTSSVTRWEIKINGDAPPGGALHFVKDTIGHNHHGPATFTGHAIGVKPGLCTITVWVGPYPGRISEDVCTGYGDSRWTIEAEEVYI